METLLADVLGQVQKFWSPIFVPELKESAVLPSLVSTEYEGQIKQGGDSVYVSMIANAAGSRKTIGAAGYRDYTPEKLTTQRVQIVADQIFEASFEIDSLAELQSQLGSANGQSKIRAALLAGIEAQMNEYLYSLIAPHASMARTGVAAFTFTELLANRKLAAKAKWIKDNNWFTLLDPSYMNDFLSETKNTSSDFVNDKPLVVGGQQVIKRSGFNILEDNSDAMAAFAGTAGGVAFHKDFMALVHQTQPVFKLSDLHANKKRGYLLSVEMVGGAKLSIEGAMKHITFKA